MVSDYFEGISVVFMYEYVSMGYCDLSGICIGLCLQSLAHSSQNCGISLEDISQNPWTVLKV